MTNMIAADPARVLEVWHDGADVVTTDLQAAHRELEVLAGADLAELGPQIKVTIRRLEGVGRAAGLLLDELGENVRTCMNAYEVTDHGSADTFTELRADV